MKNLKYRFKGICINTLMRLFQILPKKKAVICTSFDGKQYSCNPRAISEKLHEIDESIEIYWVFKDLEIDCPTYVKKLEKGSIKTIFEYARALVWIDNCNKQEYYYKSQRQLYIQTWHGDCGFKQLTDEQHICKFDVGVSSCLFGEKMVYKKAFHFDGEFYKYGSPRNDVLVCKNADQIKEIKRKLNISKGKKILIYAPTFRDSRVGKKEHISLPFNENNVLNWLKEITNQDWILLYRGHHVTKDIMEFKDKIRTIDVSEYPDMADLLQISDMLITDYSSCCCDFIIGNKPAILYHWDQGKYAEIDRATVYSDCQLPFEIAYDEEELRTSIKKMLNCDVKEYCEKIKHFFGSYESGHASEKIGEKIVSWVNNHV